MNPGKKGWLKDYITFRKEFIREYTDEAGYHSAYPDQSLYRLLQPTGLMYGQNIGTWDPVLSSNWSDKEKLKVLLAECFVSSSLLFNKENIITSADFEHLINKTIENICGFYNSIFPEVATSSKTLFGQQRSSTEVAEIILEKRVEKSAKFDKSFWSRFFHNSLLFLDIFFFGQWIHTKSDKIVADFFKSEKEVLRFSAVKILAAAAHSNEKIESEERALFDSFLAGANLKGEKRKEAIQIFNKGVSVYELDLPQSNSWILKKYFLELAILTMWADKVVEDQERGFLLELSNYLELQEEDVENSLIAIEGFVLGHWEHLDYLKGKQDYNRVSEQFISRLSRIAERNKARLVREIKDRKVLMDLFKKARHSQLNDREQESASYELVHVMKTIPAFMVASLPQNFLTLPILLKILPKDIITEALK